MVLELMVRVQGWWSDLHEQRGATAIEYALMLALIFMVVIGAVAVLGRSTNSQFTKVTFPP
jgi:Flp pilus assembly pilin Flp